ncbi:MAG: YfiR family protein [Methylomonas sp.]|nr:YfiR family protein [Methylomonas sp.]
MVFFQRNRVFSSLTEAIAKIALLFFICVGLAQGNEELEFKIKAAYLYNFTKFISWPDKNTPTFDICIVGNDPFKNLLDSLETKTAQGKPIHIIRNVATNQMSDCHIVYFDDSVPHLNPRTLAKTLVVGSLSVSSQPLFANSGGMIGFVLEDEKVKLHINLHAVKKAGLGISAKLIEVSTLVEEGEHE